MMVLVTYDVSTTDNAGEKRLRQVAKICENYGQRVQNSVFECIVEPAKWTVVRRELTDRIDKENDSLRFYFLGKNWQRRVEHIGAKPSYDQEGPLIV